VNARWLLALALFVAPAAFAQAVTMEVHPPFPTTLTPVRLEVVEALCGEITGFTRTGTTIDLTYEQPDGCVLPIPISSDFNLGLLPIGTYTVRYTLPNGGPVTVGTFAVVEPTPVPTLQTWALAVLAALLALLALRRGL
jgi:hypothetical protein